MVIPWQDVIQPVYSYGPFGGVLWARLPSVTPSGRPLKFGCALTRDQYVGVVDWMRTHGFAGASKKH
jgi:hypothetical protein